MLSLTDLAAIEGVLFYDLPGDGQIPVPGQWVCLYQDGNGNGRYDGAPTDPLRASQRTSAAGDYDFPSLSAGTYFVVQPAEPSGKLKPPPAPVVRTVVIGSGDADGTEGVTVDAFDDGRQRLSVQRPAAATGSGSAAAATALGGHRQVIVNAISGIGRVTVDIGLDPAFMFSEERLVTGNVSVIWDGTAGDHRTVNPSGLNGVDLTGGGVQDAFGLQIGEIDRETILSFLVYTDEHRVSQAEFRIRATAGDTTQLVEFARFQAVPGRAAADFASVGAISVAIFRDPGETPGLDCDLRFIRTVGPTVIRADLPYSVSSGIHLVKLTDGKDHDTDPGELVAVGSHVTWTYLVTNQGNESLTGVLVRDDNGTPGDPADDFRAAYVAGDANNNQLLEPDEVWCYTAVGAAVAGPYRNLGTVTASGAVSLSTLTHANPDQYFGVRSEIHVEKATNGFDADTPTGPVVNVGSTVTWTYEVTNPGNVPLSGLVLIDDNGTPGQPADDWDPVFVGGDGNGDGQLDPGETWRYRATGTAERGLYGNAATATGVDPLGQTPSDMDPSHYFGVQVDAVDSGLQPLIVLGPDKSPSTPQVVRVIDARTWQPVSPAGFDAYGPNHTGGTRVAVADLDANGIAEIITAPGRNAAPHIRVFSTAGGAVPGFPDFLAYSATYTGGVEVAVADVNGDGRPDIITVPSYGAANVRVFFNRYDGANPAKPAFEESPDVSFQAFLQVTTGGAVVAAADLGGMAHGSFVNDLDGKAEIVVGTGGGVSAAVVVFDVSGVAPASVGTFAPFNTEHPGFRGGVSLDVAWIDPESDPLQDPPDILVAMGVNGTSKIEIWHGGSPETGFSLRGAIPRAFTDSSDNAPVRVAGLDLDGNGITEMILAVQGPVGATGEVQRFEITGVAPFAYRPLAPVTGYSGPWFIAASKPARLGTPAAPSPAGLIWTNTANAYDVNADGAPTPRDALETIAFINAHPGETALPAEPLQPPRYFDSNADRAISPADVLFLVNSFNRISPYSGEGERSQPRPESPVASSASAASAAGCGLAECCESSSRSHNRWDQAADVFSSAPVPAQEPFVPETKTPPPSSPSSAEFPHDETHLFGLEPVLEEIAAEILAHQATSGLPVRS